MSCSLTDAQRHGPARGIGGRFGQVVGVGKDVEPPVPAVAYRVRIAVEIDETAFVVVGVLQHRDTNLAQVIDALRAVGLFLRLPESGQEHRCEDADDRDDHEQFDQSEAAAGVLSGGTAPRLRPSGAEKAVRHGEQHRFATRRRKVHSERRYADARFHRALGSPIAARHHH